MQVPVDHWIALALGVALGLMCGITLHRMLCWMRVQRLGLYPGKGTLGHVIKYIIEGRPFRA